MVCKLTTKQRKGDRQMRAEEFIGKYQTFCTFIIIILMMGGIAGAVHVANRAGVGATKPAIVDHGPNEIMVQNQDTVIIDSEPYYLGTITVEMSGTPDVIVDSANNVYFTDESDMWIAVQPEDVFLKRLEYPYHVYEAIYGIDKAFYGNYQAGYDPSSLIRVETVVPGIDLFRLFHIDIGLGPDSYVLVIDPDGERLEFEAPKRGRVLMGDPREAKIIHEDR